MGPESRSDSAAAERRGQSADLEGGVPVGHRVRLPGGAERPIQVFVNGVEQQEGSDYSLRGREVVFQEPIYKEGRLGLMRWLAMWIGLFGTYRRNDAVDLHFRLKGKTVVLTDVEILPDQPPD